MKKIVYKVLMALSMCVFLFSLYKVVSYYYGTFSSEKKYSELSGMIKDESDKDSGTREMSFTIKYEDLLKQNSDMVGWLKIEDTKMDYPVMLTPNNEEFYLRLNFDKEYEYRGTPFLNGEVDLKNEDDNMIIYAHNMDDGTMFGVLRKYTNYDYYKKHKEIQFDTLYRNGTYEIFAVFKTVDNPEHDLYINYYDFFNARNEEEFDYQINLYKNASFYDTGITPKYGDKLLTLSTCEYSNKNGRLVVVARKVDKEGE